MIATPFVRESSLSEMAGERCRAPAVTDFGRIAAIATPEAGVMSSATSLVPAMLAIGEPSTGTVRTFDWPRGATVWATEPTFSVLIQRVGLSFSGIDPSARLMMSYWYGDVMDDGVFKNVAVVIDNGVGAMSSFEPTSNRVCTYTRNVTLSVEAPFTGGCDPFTSHGSISPDGNRILKIRENETASDVLREDLIGIRFKRGLFFDTESRSASYRNFVPPNTTVVHLADASTPIDDFYIPEVRGRGYTMVLESASTMNNTNIILLHRPDIGADPNVSLIDIGERNVAKTIMLDGGVNLTEAVSSRDGTAITVSFSNGTASTHALNSDRTRWMEISMQGVLYDDSPFSEFGSALSISNGARHVAATEPGVVQTYSTKKPVCGPDEVTVRLVFSFDGNPERVGWEVFHRAGEQRGKTYGSCNRCYEWLRRLYSWSSFSTDICVPWVDLSCVGLTVEAGFVRDRNGSPQAKKGFPQDINGFAAYVVENGKATLVASDSGRAVDGSKVYSFENATVGGRCDSTEFPSLSPSRQPSTAPTTTNKPSQSPSRQPSTAPTTTKTPSQSPSRQPSTAPTTTKTPSQFPSWQPSVLPSSSDAPTSFPSFSSAPTTTCVDDGTCREGCSFRGTYSVAYVGISSWGACRSICATVDGMKAFTYRGTDRSCTCRNSFCNPTAEFDGPLSGVKVISGPV